MFSNAQLLFPEANNPPPKSVVSWLFLYIYSLFSITVETLVEIRMHKTSLLEKNILEMSIK